MTTFNKPNPAGASFKVGEHVGDLLLFLVGTYHDEVQTQYGPKPCVDVEVTVLTDGAGPPADEPKPIKARIFSAVLVSQLEGREGEYVLGRLALGAGKKGQNAPYILEDPTEQDEQIANDYLEP